MDFVLSIVLGFLAGRWLDGKLGTAPYLALAGLGFGLAAGFRFLWRAARRARRETEQDGFKASSTDRQARFALEHADHD